MCEELYRYPEEGDLIAQVTVLFQGVNSGRDLRGDLVPEFENWRSGKKM